MSGDAVEGFRLKPGDGSKQFSDYLAKLQLAEVALQQTRPTVSADVTPAVDTPRLLKQQWAGAGLDRLDCSGLMSLPQITPITTGTGEADSPSPAGTFANQAALQVAAWTPQDNAAAVFDDPVLHHRHPAGAIRVKNP